MTASSVAESLQERFVSLSKRAITWYITGMKHRECACPARTPVLFVVISFAAMAAAAPVAPGVPGRTGDAAPRAAADAVARNAFRDWLRVFRAEDVEYVTNAVSNAEAEGFLLANAPYFVCPDKDVERAWAYRWWSLRKHFFKSLGGWCVSEFTDTRAISCPVGHHLFEGRWLRNREIYDDYTRYWFKPGANPIHGPGSYINWIVQGVLARETVTGDRALADSLLEAFIANYEAWETGWEARPWPAEGLYKMGLKDDGLFHDVDDREGTELTLSGNGARVHVNAMMYGEAKAIAKIASRNGRASVAAAFEARAARLERLVKARLWNAEQGFFCVRRDDGALSDVCELHGYSPWYAGMPLDDEPYAAAWRWFSDKERGFAAPRGLTFPVQSAKGFKISYEGHCCQWNGPSWPFASSVALTALNRALRSGAKLPIGRDAWLEAFLKYARQHVQKKADGKVEAWLDEVQDPYTGDWIAYRRWQRDNCRNYNHSTFCDLVVTGLVGLQVADDGSVTVEPNVPASWTWFRLENVPVRDRLVTVTYDRDGTRFGGAKGLSVVETAAGGQVTVVDCPKCERFARYADDGKSATVNRARLQAGTPAETEAAITAAVRRAEAVLAANVLPDESVRPLMGWSSWNCFALDIDEEKIVSQARVMATNGLKAAGYLYVNTDDGFFDGHDEKGNLKWNLKRFPQGMKPVADGIHACGLKAGIYSDAGEDMCGGSKGSGLYGHDAADCDLHFNRLGFDYIKVDYCGGSKLGLDEEQRYTEISKAIRATGRNVKFNVCRWGFPGAWVSGVADSWRVTGDIRATWKSIREIVLIGLPLSAYASRGHYNDLDMLEFGHRRNWKPSFDGDTGLSPTEETSHFGLWCILSSPLVLGCDLREMPADALALATNPYLLQMNANDLGLQAYPVRFENEVVTLVKDAGGRYGLSRYVALVNLGDEPAKVALRSDDVDLAGRTHVVDLVAKAEVGSFVEKMELALKPHEGRFYRLFAEKRLPRRVYRADCAWLRRFHKLHWDGDAPLYRHVMPGPGETWDAVVAVSGLGRDGKNDLVWRDVRVEETRDYNLTFTVLSPDPRRFSVSVDGAPAVELAVPARRWTQEVSCVLKLSAGTHEVRLFNAKDPAPDVVQMAIR